MAPISRVYVASTCGSMSPSGGNQSQSPPAPYGRLTRTNTRSATCSRPTAGRSGAVPKGTSFGSSHLADVSLDPSVRLASPGVVMFSFGATEGAAPSAREAETNADENGDSPTSTARSSFDSFTACSVPLVSSYAAYVCKSSAVAMHAA